MNNDVWSRDEIQSPCVNTCVIDEVSGLCIGCLRTRPEIAGWSRISASERQALMLELAERAPLLAKRKRRGRRKQV